MSRKEIADSLKKVKTAEKILSGEIGVNESSRLAGVVSQFAIQRWRDYHMKQSMFRVAHCIDNGSMEGF